MSSLLINALSIPEGIRKTLLQFAATKYEVESYDNKASNGYVFFATNKILGSPIVIKFYYWGGKDRYHAEPTSLTKITSKNVLPVLDAGLADEEWAYFVSPRMPGGDLDDLIAAARYSNRQAMALVRDVLIGASHLHQKRLLHRDLKPGNIYLGTQGEAVIGDFGSVRFIPDNENDVPASSHALIYRPPEATGHSGRFGVRSDVYQTGMVLYQLLGGSLPYEQYDWLTPAQKVKAATLEGDFEQSSYIDGCIVERIRKGTIVRTETMPEWVPQSLVKIVKKACHVDAGKRYSDVAEFLHAIEQCGSTVRDWRLGNGELVLHDDTSYRVTGDEQEGYLVQKRRTGGWKKHVKLSGSKDLTVLVRKIEEQ